MVKVLDFGISKIRGSNTVLTQDAALLGTPQYMAPEQATGRNDEIDARTDVFAFGAMTFEMLAGKPPFTGDTLAAVIHAIVYAPTPPLATLATEMPPAIVAAIERAMEKNRDARFPDVNSFVKAVTSRSLATAPGTEQVSARPMTVAATERISRLAAHARPGACLLRPLFRLEGGDQPALSVYPAGVHRALLFHRAGGGDDGRGFAVLYRSAA